jgi:hypothetical protein
MLLHCLDEELTRCIHIRKKIIVVVMLLDEFLPFDFSKKRVSTI